MFGIGKMANSAIEEELTWKGAIGGLIVIMVAGGFTLFSAYSCQKCYDINFAVAMKNINYTHITEVNTNIEMNYQDITKDK